MARSSTSIANRALTIIGGSGQITSLNDNTKGARVMNRNFTPILEELLTQHNWGFAIKRASLAALTEEEVEAAVPDNEFTNAFAMPDDCLKPILVLPKYIEWQREGEYILANSDELTLKYIYRVTDVNLFTPEFAELFAKKLAAAGCMSISQSVTLTDKLDKEYLKYFQWATSDDSKGSGTPKPAADDIWMAHRGEGYYTGQDAIVLDDFDYGSL